MAYVDRKGEEMNTKILEKAKNLEVQINMFKDDIKEIENAICEIHTLNVLKSTCRFDLNIINCKVLKIHLDKPQLLKILKESLKYKNNKLEELQKEFREL